MTLKFPLFGISPSAVWDLPVGRIISRRDPLLTLAPGNRKPGRRRVLIVDGTLLDGVLCGAADQSLVAAQGCGEAKKAEVVAGVAFVSGAQTAVAGQPGGWVGRAARVPAVAGPFPSGLPPPNRT